MIFDKINKSFGALFLLILLIEVISSKSEDFSRLHTVAMPLLLAYLFIFFYLRRQGTSIISKILLFSALGCAFTGDIFLSKELSIFDSENSLGYICHALAHALLVILFYNGRNKKNKGYQFLLPLLIIAGLFMFFNYKYQYEETLNLFSFVQLVLILTMIYFSFLRKNNVTKESYTFILIGSVLLFISYIFVNFEPSLQFEVHDFIMIPYATAFLCFVIGIIKEKQTSFNF
ncbi:lysoplasmalogenase family protein [Flavobacteriaceae bacterium]|nr:lysoplasmalogenase family protein [Flavobacteriaceae bacterium]